MPLSLFLLPLSARVFDFTLTAEQENRVRCQASLSVAHLLVVATTDDYVLTLNYRLSDERVLHTAMTFN